MAVVYQHKRLNDQKIFYIGIEFDTDKKKATGKRSRKKCDKSEFWKKVVNKYGYEIDILFNDITNEEAIQIEKYLIAYYGRRDLGLGYLVNLTDGGEGTINYLMSQQTKDKISIKAKGRIVSEKTRNKLSEVGKGKVVSLDNRKKLSERMKGNKQFEGKKHSEETKLLMSQKGGLHIAKKVINTETGEIFNSIIECSKFNNISYSKLQHKLSGKLLNDTFFTYLNE